MKKSFAQKRGAVLYHRGMAKKKRAGSDRPKLCAFLEPKLLDMVKQKAKDMGVSASEMIHDMLAKKVKFEVKPNG